MFDNLNEQELTKQAGRQHLNQKSWIPELHLLPDK